MAAPAARLFFALWPNDAVRAGLFRLAQTLHRDCGGRLIRGDNLHQTLVFLGKVAADRIPGLAALAVNRYIPPFELRLNDSGYWRHNRIVWVAPGAVPEPLRELVAALEGALNAAGFDFDRRPYAPHITLVRNAREPRLLLAPDLAWPVSEFALVESASNEGGSRYRIIARWPLAPSDR